MKGQPMTVTSREATVRDFVIFQVKLALDGFKDFVIFNMSIGAIVLDFIAGRGKRPRLFYSVVRLSERFEDWLNLHGVVQQLDAEAGGDPVVGAGTSGADALIGEIEQRVRGREGKRGSSAGAGGAPKDE